MRFFSPTRYVGLATLGLSVLGTAAGCNAIFGIEEGTLGKGGDGTGAQAGEGGSGAQGGDGGAGAQGGDGGAGAQGGTGGDGGGGGAPLECDPTKLDDNEKLDPSCGIFVNAEFEEGGNGSQQNPFKFLSAALGDVNNTKYRVYLCGEAEYPVGGAVVSEGVSLYGGVNCSWGPSSLRPKIVKPSGAPTLRIDATETVILQNLDVVAAAGQKSGEPSIAVFSRGTDLVLTGVRLEAANGANGADGTNPPTQATSGAPGESAICDEGPSGLGGLNLACPIGTAGGAGGRGTDDDCVFGMSETGMSGSGPAGGIGGALGLVGDSTCSGCTGGDGGDGIRGLDGLNAGKFGSLGPGGWAPSSPIFATGGQNGSGGGGGGNGAYITGGAGIGGGGGAGGCGGAAGRSGENGGASFALVIDGGALTATDLVLISRAGGNGGNGRAGQLGGVGGSGGNGTQGAYAGGLGGRGGDGGNGGVGAGGDGGPSALIAFRDVDANFMLNMFGSSNLGFGGVGGQAGPDNPAVGLPGPRCLAMKFTEGEYDESSCAFAPPNP